MDDVKTGDAGYDLTLLEGLLLQIFVDGKPLLTGEVSHCGDGELTFERRAGQRGFACCDAGSAVSVRGFTPCVLEGVVKESTVDRCRICGVRAVRTGSRHRSNFRLTTEDPVTIWADGASETAVLVDLSAGGACVHTGTARQRGDMLRLELRLEDTPPVTCQGKVVRVDELSPGAYRCGIQFLAQSEADISALATAVYRLEMRKKRNGK